MTEGNLESGKEIRLLYLGGGGGAVNHWKQEGNLPIAGDEQVNVSPTKLLRQIFSVECVGLLRS